MYTAAYKHSGRSPVRRGHIQNLIDKNGQGQFVAEKGFGNFQVDIHTERDRIVSEYRRVVDTHKKFPHILIEKRTICTVVQI